MIPFLAAQSADPFDPTPMLILADHLEEQGDLAGAGVLRGLAEAGIASLVELAGAAGMDLWSENAGSKDGGPNNEFSYPDYMFAAGPDHGLGTGQGHSDPEGTGVGEEDELGIDDYSGLRSEGDGQRDGFGTENRGWGEGVGDERE